MKRVIQSREDILMHPYTVELLTDLPVILATVDESYRVSKHIEGMAHDVRILLDNASHPVYLINDLSKHHMPNVDELMMGAKVIAYGHDTIYHHPNVREILIVTQNDVLRMAYQSGLSEGFGKLSITVVDSLDDAMAYVRAHP
jgi:hypothetical protein